MISGRTRDNLYDKFALSVFLLAFAAVTLGSGYYVSQACQSDPELQWVEKKPLKKTLAKTTEKKEKPVALELAQNLWKKSESK